MADNNILTAEEQAYLAEVTSEESGGAIEPPTSFKIEGSWEANELLSRLASNSTLSLQADCGHFHLSFPVKLVEDEFHTLHVELAPPTIYEDGANSRVWRLQLPKPLPLLEANGGRSSLRVRELSPDGLLVDTVRRRRAPERFDLHLPLPDGDAMPISAQRVRSTMDGLTAYKVELAGTRDTERLRQFIYNHHQRLHPELRPNLALNLV